MSEAEPKHEEYFAAQVEAYEPARLDDLKPAEAACSEKCGPEDDDESDTDVELESGPDESTQFSGE